MRTEELILFIREEIEKCNERIKYLQSILELLEKQNNGWKPGEKIEEAKEGRKKYGIIYVGEDYVRAVPNYEMPNVSEIDRYLKDSINDLREMQARLGGDSPLAEYEVKGNNTINEIVISNLFSPVEIVRAKGILKHALIVGYEIYKSRKK